MSEVPDSPDKSRPRSTEDELYEGDKDKEHGILKNKDDKHKSSKKIPKGKGANKLLPYGISFDPKSGFVDLEDDIPEPTVLLDYEYRTRLHRQLNK